MNIVRAINQITTPKLSVRAAEIVVYGAALLIMIIGIPRVVALGLTEANLLFGIVLVLILAMQTVSIGMLIGFRAGKS